MTSKYYVLFLILNVNQLCSAQVGNATFNKNARLAGGKAVNLKQFPYVVCLKLLRIGENKSMNLCTGSIITDRWVLSAAHCGQEDIDYSRSLVVAAVTNCWKKEENAQERKIERIVRYETWNPAEELENDIGLFEVNTPFVFDSYVAPIALAKKPFPSEDVLDCTSVGYGQDANEQVMTLNFVQTRGGGSRFCEETYGITKPNTVEYLICLKPLNRSDESTGLGDSGGPLVCQGLLAGIVSSQIVPDTEYGLECCDPRRIQICNFAGYFESWIRKHVPNLPASKLLAGKYSRSLPRSIGRGLANDQSTSGTSRSTYCMSIVILTIFHVLAI